MAKPSRAAARRVAAEKRAAATTAAPLPPAHDTFLADYTPERVDPTTWDAIRAAHREIMTAANVQGLESFKKRSRELAQYLARRYDEGLSIAIEDALTYAATDDDYARPVANHSDTTRNDRRSRLRKVAEAVNPGLGALPRAQVRGHQALKPPYTSREEHAIKRIAERQRNATSRRNLCAVVGFCGGGGLGSIDLRDLYRRHVHDYGDDGIRVDVPGRRPRTVWIRRDYENLVRIGIDGLRPGQLIIGKTVSRRNIVGAVVERAEILGDAPHIEASRLRSTWLAWLMCRTVPLNVLLNAAGLQSARSLIDLLPYLGETPTSSTDALRGSEDAP